MPDAVENNSKAGAQVDLTTLSLDQLLRLDISQPLPRQLQGEAPANAGSLAGDDTLPLPDDLPPPNTKRWGIRRKVKVLAAIRGGLISQEEAFSSYSLSAEELLSWQALIERHGMRGLRVTCSQYYRPPEC